MTNTNPAHERNPIQPTNLLQVIDAPNISPLTDALQAAIATAAAAEQAYLNDDDTDADRAAALLAASNQADDAIETARVALAESDEPREFSLCEEDNWYATIMAGSLAEALKEARDGVDASNYEIEGSTRFSVAVRCDLTGEEGEDSVTLDPEAPACADDDTEHDWRSPYSVLGGLKENPGVWGSDHGGVKCREVCLYCGTYKTEDSGGTDRSNGTRMDTTSYEDADEDSSAWVARKLAESVSAGERDGAEDPETMLAEQGIDALRATMLESNRNSWDEAAINAGVAEIKRIPEGHRKAYYEAYEAGACKRAAELLTEHDDAAMTAACPYDGAWTSENEYTIHVALKDAGDDDEAAAVVAEIAAAIGSGWSIAWTGDANGDESDLRISRVS